MNPDEVLAAGLTALGVDVPGEAQSRLLAYVALLARWNRVYNLTAVRDPAEMMRRHVLDSLAVLPHLQGPRVIDVGSGAGLPGIPLAIASPACRFVLLDANAKKTRFLIHAVGELALTNVEVVRSRVEDYRPESGFDSVISRAFASLADMLALTARLCRPGGRLLAMKGRIEPDELAAIPPAYGVPVTTVLHVPGVRAERHLVSLACPDG